MKRATIIVSGDVQEVGYRPVVMAIAQKLGLTGYVENASGGTVKIICEGDEETIAEFIGHVRIKNEMADVKSIDTKFEEPTGEFEEFAVKFGELASEMSQGFGTARKYLQKGIEETKKVGEKVDIGFKELGEKVEQNIIETRKVGEKVEQNILETRGFREDTIACFDRLDEKYHIVSDVLTSMNTNMDHMHRETQAAIEQLTQSTTALTRLTEAVEKLVENHIRNEEK